MYPDTSLDTLGVDHDSDDRPSARRAGSGGAAIAMVTGCDLTVIELLGVKVANVSGSAVRYRKIEHLVEVAVVEDAIPAH
jgi:hypothetical protein